MFGFFFRKEIVSIGLLLTLVLIFSGCTAGEGGKVPEINSLTFGHSGMSSWDCYNFTVRRTGSGAQAELEIVSIEKPLVKDVKPEILDEFRTLIEANNVMSWDGFKGPNPPNVLDGSGFSLSVIFADGKKIRASGSNNFPKGYSAVSKKIKEMVKSYRKELLLREGLIKEEVPPAHLAMTYLDEFRETDDGLVRTRRAYLSPQDERKYPKLAEKIKALNEIVRTKEHTAIISVVRADNRVTSLTLFEKPSLDAGYADCHITTYNYYTESGEDIVLSAIAHGKKEDFIRMNRNILRSHYGEKNLYPLEEIYEKMLKAPEKMVYSIGHEATIVYFQPGEVAPKEKGIRQVERAYMYDWQLTKDIKEMPDTWASGMVAAMDVFTVVSDPKIKTRMKRMNISENPELDKRVFFHVHFGFEKEYLYEFYYEDGFYQPGQERLERVYRIKGNNLELVEERNKATLPEVDEDDYCNYIFGPTDLYPVVTDVSVLKPPAELSEG